jgi:hypothetical protein
MITILNKIKIIGTNNQLLQRVESFILFGVSSKKYSQEQTNTYYNFREILFKLTKLHLDFKPAIKYSVCGLFGHSSMLIFQD